MATKGSTSCEVENWSVLTQYWNGAKNTLHTGNSVLFVVRILKCTFVGDVVACANMTGTHRILVLLRVIIESRFFSFLFIALPERFWFSIIINISVH